MRNRGCCCGWMITRVLLMCTPQRRDDEAFLLRPHLAGHALKPMIAIIVHLPPAVRLTVMSRWPTRRFVMDPLAVASESAATRPEFQASGVGEDCQHVWLRACMTFKYALGRRARLNRPQSVSARDTNTETRPAVKCNYRYSRSDVRPRHRRQSAIPFIDWQLCW